MQLSSLSKSELTWPWPFLAPNAINRTMMVNSTVTRKMVGTDNSQIFMVKHIRIFSITNNQRGKRRRDVEQTESTKLQTGKMAHYRQLVKSGYNGIS